MKPDQLQDEVDEWMNVHGGCWSELPMYARLAEEAGELGEVNWTTEDRPEATTAWNPRPQTCCSRSQPSATNLT